MITLALLLAAQSASLHAGEQPTVAVALLTSGDGAPVSLSRLLDTIAPALDDAGLAVRSMEQVGVDTARLRACSALTRLSCWARVVERAAGASALRHLLVVSARTDARRLRLSAIFLDLDDTARIFADGGPDETRAENALFDAALRIDETVLPRRQRAVRAWFDAIAAGPLRGFLEARGQWRSLGAVEIVGAAPGTQVVLDDRVLGTARTPSTTIDQVAPGARKIVLLRSSTSSTTHPFDLPPAGLARIVVPSVVEEHHTAAWLTLGGSAAAVVAGGVLAAVAASRASDVRAGCLRVGGEDCEGRSVSHRFDTGALPTTRLDDVDPGGVPLAAIGVALVSSGIGAGVSTALTWDEFEGWLPALVGVAAGLVGFGATALATGAF